MGNLEFRFFADFPGASLGHFVWTEEDRTSAYDEPFNNAIVFVNERLIDDRPWRRFVSTKELMHVFDSDGGKADTEEKYRLLVQELASHPLLTDASEPYAADRVALWKAIVALVPPWIRDDYKDAWESGSVDASELAARWWIPESIASVAMGSYYEQALDQFIGSED